MHYFNQGVFERIICSLSRVGLTNHARKAKTHGGCFPRSVVLTSLRMELVVVEPVWALEKK